MILGGGRLPFWQGKSKITLVPFELILRSVLELERLQALKHNPFGGWVFAFRSPRRIASEDLLEYGHRLSIDAWWPGWPAVFFGQQRSYTRKVPFP